MSATTDTTTERSTDSKTMADMVVRAADRYEGTALKWNSGEEWQELSYGELGERVRAIAKGLVALGVEPGDRVAIFADTRPEWTLADFGTLCAGAVVAPIYQTSSEEEAQHILENSESKVVFCENDELLGKVENVRGETSVEHLVLIEGDASGDTLSWDDLIERGKEIDDSQVDERIENVSPDDLFSLIYTSGTTGPPKGCELTHGNYRSNLDMLEQAVEIGEDPVVFVFLPLAHALTRMMQMLAIDTGAVLAFWRRDKDKLMDDLQEVRPTHFPAVPRIFEKIYNQ